MIDDMVRPNGLAFSPDEKLLYVADTGATHKENGPRHIRRFAVGAGRQELSRAARCSPNRTAGLFDGFRVDADGPHLDQHRARASIATTPTGR